MVSSQVLVLCALRHSLHRLVYGVLLAPSQNLFTLPEPGRVVLFSDLVISDADASLPVRFLQIFRALFGTDGDLR